LHVEDIEDRVVIHIEADVAKDLVVHVVKNFVVRGVKKDTDVEHTAEEVHMVSHIEEDTVVDIANRIVEDTVEDAVSHTVAYDVRRAFEDVQAHEAHHA